jgi:hypothetical protein
MMAANDPMSFLARMQSAMTNMAQISAALPDIQLLVAQYHHSVGELARREDMVRRVAAQQSETLKQKEQHIEMLLKKFEELQRDHAKETSRMRMEMGNLEEKHRGLEVDLKSLTGHKDRMQEDHKIFISRREAELDVHRNELVSSFKSTVRDRELQLEDQKQKMETQASIERQNLQNNHETDLNAATAQHLQELEEVRKEKDDLFQRLTSEREEEKKKGQDLLHGQQKELDEKYDRDRDELRLMHIKQINEMKTETEMIKRKLEEDRDLERANMDETILTLKRNLYDTRQEKERLQQLADSYPESSDLKSKNDLYL